MSNSLHRSYLRDGYDEVAESEDYATLDTELWIVSNVLVKAALGTPTHRYLSSNEWFDPRRANKAFTGPTQNFLNHYTKPGVLYTQLWGEGVPGEEKWVDFGLSYDALNQGLIAERYAAPGNRHTGNPLGMTVAALYVVLEKINKKIWRAMVPQPQSNDQMDLASRMYDRMIKLEETPRDRTYVVPPQPQDRDGLSNELEVYNQLIFILDRLMVETTPQELRDSLRASYFSHENLIETLTQTKEITVRTGDTVYTNSGMQHYTRNHVPDPNLTIVRSV